MTSTSTPAPDEATRVGATAAGLTRGRLRRGQWRALIPLLLLTPLAAAWIYPFLWMVMGSFKKNTEFFGSASLLPSEFYWENWQRAWYRVEIGKYFVNTVVVTVGTIAIVVVTSAMIGYVLGRFTFPGKKVVIAAFAVTVLVPEGYTIIPLFDLINGMGLEGTLLGIILAESGGAHVMIILLFAGYFRQLPNELAEAASIDGAGFVRTFVSIMLPLSTPVIATAVILTLMRAWNSFLIPLVLTLSAPESRTLAVAVYAFQGEDVTDWSGMTAASTISLLPIVIVFLFMQRYFIEGLTGAVRG